MRRRLHLPPAVRLASPAPRPLPPPHSQPRSLPSRVEASAPYPRWLPPRWLLLAPPTPLGRPPERPRPLARFPSRHGRRSAQHLLPLPPSPSVLRPPQRLLYPLPAAPSASPPPWAAGLHSAARLLGQPSECLLVSAWARGPSAWAARPRRPLAPHPPLPLASRRPLVPHRLPRGREPLAALPLWPGVHRLRHRPLRSPASVRPPLLQPPLARRQRPPPQALAAGLQPPPAPFLGRLRRPADSGHLLRPRLCWVGSARSHSRPGGSAHPLLPSMLLRRQRRGSAATAAE
mmetsp:Transcript_28945/g.92341  ORF Transcript_28945/g.92341 Transcript_28945/m.92341 type:complete len:289 (+) Transcript_28945:228-1094(+)